MLFWVRQYDRVIDFWQQREVEGMLDKNVTMGRVNSHNYDGFVDGVIVKAKEFQQCILPLLQWCQKQFFWEDRITRISSLKRFVQNNCSMNRSVLGGTCKVRLTELIHNNDSYYTLSQKYSQETHYVEWHIHWGYYSVKVSSQHWVMVPSMCVAHTVSYEPSLSRVTQHYFEK